MGWLFPDPQLDRIEAATETKDPDVPAEPPAESTGGDTPATGGSDSPATGGDTPPESTGGSPVPA